MAKQVLVPARSSDDAKSALRYLNAVASPGDDVVVLVIADEMEAEYTGGQPPPIASEPLAMTTGYAAARVPEDIPTFVSSEELMEKRGQEIRDGFAPVIEELHEKGYKARLDVAFSNSPAATIRDAAGDLDTGDVFVTADFYGRLETDDSNIARVIPGT